MPTTCGFPNCKFRSRYRGYHDNRHFYRVPKKPAVLRERWLEAIGRTEGTIINQQLRVCSGHFHGGKKNEGDIPVADPEVDPPVHVDLPPAPPKRTEKVPKARRTVIEKLRKNASSGGSGAALHGDNRTPYSDCEFDPGIVKATNNMAFTRPVSSVSSIPPKPLVAYLDGKDCSVELDLLKDFSIVAFCDALHEEDIHERVYKEATAVFLFQHMQLTRETLKMFRSLKLIVKMGCNCDNIDIEAASNLGIAVSLISGCATEEVADMTFSFILNLYHETFHLADAFKDGRSCGRPDNAFTGGRGLSRLSGECLGIVGFGRIGSAVAVRAKAFGFKIFFYDPYIEDGREKSLGVNRVDSLKELLSLSDCVSLHCTYNQKNRHMLNDAAFSYMHSGAFLVNTANGNLICENALATALKSGIIRGAALDVHEMEPFDLQQSPLQNCPNLICTPNVSVFSEQSFVEMKRAMAEEIRRGLLGRMPRDLKFCVNRTALLQHSLGEPSVVSSVGNLNPTNTSASFYCRPACFQAENSLPKEPITQPPVPVQPFQPLVTSCWPSTRQFPSVVPDCSGGWSSIFPFADSRLLSVGLQFQPMLGAGQPGIPRLPVVSATNGSSSFVCQQPFNEFP